MKTIDSMIDVEALAYGVATNVTYLFRNVHEKMSISNITLLDGFTKEFKFDVTHRVDRRSTWVAESLEPGSFSCPLLHTFDKLSSLSK